jgi:hypothetical protein
LGKSSLDLTEVLSMASGKRLLNAKPKDRCRVWYWNGEDPFDEMERRVYGIALHYGLEAQDLEGYLWLDSGRDSPMRVAEETAHGAKIVQPVFDEMKGYILDNGIDCLVVDPFVSTHAVSENDNSIINDVVKGFARLADQCNIAVELVHHVKKSRDDVETQAEDARGASALVDACRSVRALSRMPKDLAQEYGLTDTERKSLFFMSLGKANLGPPVDPKWFKLIGVDIGNGDMDNRSDDVGVVTTWEAPSLFSGITNDDIHDLQVRISQMGDCRRDPKSDSYVGRVVCEAFGLDAYDESVKKRVKSMIEAWLRSGLLVMTTEKNRQCIRVGKSIHDAGT